MVPSIIVLAIVLGIWLIYPAYSNGSTGVKDRRDQLQAEKLKLDSILGKSGNASSLSSQLESLQSDRDVLYEFVPVDMKESEIIDNLNKMASDSGLLVYGISISQPKLEVASVEAPVTMGSTSLDPSNPMGNTDVNVVVLPKVKNFEADMQISGNYEQIKTFLEKMDIFARYVSVNNVFLKKGLSTTAVPSADSTTDTASLDVLTANLKLDFDILEKAKLSNDNITDPVFSSSSLDTKVISQIKAQYSNAALKLDIGQTGKPNPFLP